MKRMKYALTNVHILNGRRDMTVVSGKAVIVDGNPLDDLTLLRTPHEVIFRGKRIRNPKPKKYPMVERELDKILAL